MNAATHRFETVPMPCLPCSISTERPFRSIRNCRTHRTTTPGFTEVLPADGSAPTGSQSVGMRSAGSRTPEPFSGPSAGPRGLDLAIARLGIRGERTEQIFGDRGNAIDGLRECRLVCLRGLWEARYLSHKLE